MNNNEQNLNKIEENVEILSNDDLERGASNIPEPNIEEIQEENKDEEANIPNEVDQERLNERIDNDFAQNNKQNIEETKEELQPKEETKEAPVESQSNNINIQEEESDPPQVIYELPDGENIQVFAQEK